MKVNLLFLNILLGSLLSTQNAARPIKNDLMALKILQSSFNEAAIAIKNSVSIDSHSFLTYHWIFANIHIKNNETKKRFVDKLNSLFNTYNGGYLYIYNEKDECPFTGDLCNMHTLLLNLIQEEKAHMSLKEFTFDIFSRIEKFMILLICGLGLLVLLTISIIFCFGCRLKLSKD